LDDNAAIDYLAELVSEKNNLPPKILIVHQVSMQGTITGHEKIKKVPEVQVAFGHGWMGDKILKDPLTLVVHL